MNTQREDEAKLCPTVEAAFVLLGKKWTGLIIHRLLERDFYFCELEEAIPALSARVLTLRMRELEDEGIVTRKVGHGTIARVSYSLTEKGRGLGPVLNGIAEWAGLWYSNQSKSAYRDLDRASPQTATLRSAKPSKA
jgi:DNA-binding HxlR family transcriptional regulator